MNPTGSHAFASLVRLAVLALVVVLALPPAATAAVLCVERRAEGKISIDQQGLNIVLDLRQNGNTLSGEAEYVRFATGDRVRGQIIGSHFDAGSMQLRIRWYSSSVTLSTGIYIGKIDREGWVRGHTYDERNAAMTATWKSRRPLPCRKRFRY